MKPRKHHSRPACIHIYIRTTYCSLFVVTNLIHCGSPTCFPAYFVIILDHLNNMFDRATTHTATQPKSIRMMFLNALWRVAFSDAKCLLFKPTHHQHWAVDYIIVKLRHSWQKLAQGPVSTHLFLITLYVAQGAGMWIHLWHHRWEIAYQCGSR